MALEEKKHDSIFFSWTYSHSGQIWDCWHAWAFLVQWLRNAAEVRSGRDDTFRDAFVNVAGEHVKFVGWKEENADESRSKARKGFQALEEDSCCLNLDDKPDISEFDAWLVSL